MRRIFFLMMIMAAFWACENGGQEPAAQQYTGSAAPPVAPDAERFGREIQALTTSYGPGKDVWMFEYYLISPVDSAKSYANMGRWFMFYPDGTFKNGRWSEDIGQGSWFLREGPYGPFLKLDNVIDSEDMEFNLQGMNGAMDEWSWVGTKAYGRNNNFAKAIRLYSKPTKEQFGFTRE